MQANPRTPHSHHAVRPSRHVGSMDQAVKLLDLGFDESQHFLIRPVLTESELRICFRSYRGPFRNRLATEAE